MKRFGMFCGFFLALAIGACGLTGSSTRSVNSGPGMTNQAATGGQPAPAVATWQDTCGPAAMMTMDTVKGWSGAVGPCYDRVDGKPAARPGGLEYFKGQHGALVLRVSSARNAMTGPTQLVAVADWQAQNICFAVFPAGLYNPTTIPTSSVMECGSSAEFPKRWLRSIECNGGNSCDFDLFVVCQREPCKVGAIGIMTRPKDGPG